MKVPIVDCLLKGLSHKEQNRVTEGMQGPIGRTVSSVSIYGANTCFLN